MAYQIDRYNNTLLTIVEDGTTDSTATDIKFIGKNYAGYGEIQNENLLFLLENFSGANAPPRAISGQVWFDSANSKLKFYDGNLWRTTGGSEVAEIEPSGLTVGDFWWDTANDQLYVFNGSNFVLIGPQNAGEGVTQFVSDEILDNTGTTKSIIRAVINDETIYIISAQEFTLSPSNPIVGFDRIKRGLTLTQTQQGKNGITDPADTWYWGTASNAALLNGKSDSDFVLADQLIFTQLAEFSNDGIAIGTALPFKINLENDEFAVIENDYNTDSQIRFKTTDGSGTSQLSLIIQSSVTKPATDNIYDLGEASTRFKNIYATRFVGTTTTSETLLVNSQELLGSVDPTPDTVAVRTNTGNLRANLFEGVATTARYADLAEKYSTDQEYPVGTVVTVCEHDAHEVEAASENDIAVGVVSENPALMMNSEAEGQYIGLKGRLPIRIVGPITKGNAVYAWKDGTATGATLSEESIVGIALETNNNEGEKLVECVLKV